MMDPGHVKRISLACFMLHKVTKNIERDGGQYDLDGDDTLKDNGRQR